MDRLGSVLMRGLRGAVLLVTGLLTLGLVPPGLQAVEARAAESLAWGPCPPETPTPPDAAAMEDYECAMLDVPRSHQDTDGPTVRMAVGRLPAADQRNKIGTIVYNPGGPGNPGRIPPVLTPELRQRFDIVGFDPRGIGASDGLRCFARPEQQRLFAGPFPITPEQERAKISQVSKGMWLCERNAGPLRNHMSATNVASDLDLLRAALGEKRLNFFGHSYGGHLGAIYVNRYPQRVRTAVLDAMPNSVRITGGDGQHAAQPATYRSRGFVGAQHALRGFLAACAADERCAFRETRSAGEAGSVGEAELLAKYNTVLDKLERGPVSIPGPDGMPMRVTYQAAVGRTLGLLERASNSPELARFLQALHEAPRSSARAEPIPVSEQDGGLYLGKEQGLGMCADTTNPPDPRVWSRFAHAADRVARGFGSLQTYISLPCGIGSKTDPDRYTGPWDRPTVNPILLIGNGRGDPNAPYADQRRMADLLGNARLLTLDSFGHGARGVSRCVDAALNRYFTSGVAPADGAVCLPDREPFDGPAPS